MFENLKTNHAEEPKALTQAIDLAYSPAGAASLPKLQRTELVRKEAGISGPSGFMDGVAEGAFRQPVLAAQQLLGMENKSNSPAAVESGSQQAGKIVGSILPFVAASVLTKAASTRLLGPELASTPSIYRMMGEQATAGMLMGTFLTHSDLKPGESLVAARLRQGAESAITFGAMAGTAGVFEQALPKYGAGFSAQIARRMTIGGLSGTVGGLVDAEVKTDFRATKEQLLTSALGYAAFGTLMEGGGALGRAFMRPATVLPMSRAGSNDANILLASDANATIISSPGGWYDKLKTAIYKAPKDHTIVVTDPKWLEEGKRILLSAKRSDLNLVFEQAPLRTSSGAAPKSEPARTESAKTEAATETAAQSYEQKAQLIDNLRKEIVKNGEEPLEAITAALKRSRVVMVGEYHVVDSAHRELGAELMPKLKQAGLTHLAIEHSRDFKGKVFGADGLVDKGSLPDLLSHPEFYKLLQSAKKAGIEVVPVDASYKGSRKLDYRNRIMDQEITAILEDPKNKVLFWVGNKHLQMVDAVGDGPQVAQLLRDRKIPVTSFYGSHDNFWREEPLRTMFTPGRALAVPVESSPNLGKLSFLHSDQPGFGTNSYREFNYVIVHPHQAPSHWD